MNKRGVLIITIILFFITLFADELKKIDSLKRNLYEVNREARIENYLLIAEYYRVVNVDSTIKYGILAIKESQEIGDIEREAFSQRSLGVSFFYISDLENAMYYFRQSLNAYLSINHKLGVSNCYNGIGKIFEQKLDLDSANYYLNNSLELRVELNDLEQIAASYVNIGNLYYYRGQLSTALQYYLNSLSITLKLGVIDDIGDAYLNIGIIYSELNNFLAAMDYYNKADSIFESIKNIRSTSTVYLNKADIYNFHLNNPSEALKLYNKSLEIKINLNDKSGIALINNNIGTTYGNIEDYQTAIIYLQNARQLYSELDNQSGLIMVFHNLGNAYFSVGENSKAIAFFNNSLNRAKNTDFNYYITANYKSLTKAYAANCDYENFEKYYNLNQQVTDSLLSNLDQAQLSKVETDFIANELSEENEDLKIRIVKLSQKSKTRFFVIIGLSMLLFIGILIQIIYFLIIKKSK